jgi:hypothetical protein
MAWECDAQWSGVKQRKNAAPSMPGGQRATGGSRPPWPLTASWWGPGWGANGPTSSPWPWCQRPTLVCEPGTGRRCAPRPLPATNRHAWRGAAVGTRPKHGVVRCDAGAKGWPLGTGKSPPQVGGWRALPSERSRAKPVWRRCGLYWGPRRATRVWERVTTARVVSGISGKSARPWHVLKPGALPAGCGGGRWASPIAVGLPAV